MTSTLLSHDTILSGTDGAGTAAMDKTSQSSNPANINGAKSCCMVHFLTQTLKLTVLYQKLVL